MKEGQWALAVPSKGNAAFPVVPGRIAKQRQGVVIA